MNMPRNVEEIARDVKAAATSIAQTNAKMAKALGGNPPPNALPSVQVRLADDRVIELGALADELLAAVSHRD
jgi:hypothetical protein